MEALLPAATSDPALAALTIRRGQRPALLGYREALKLLRERRDGQLEMLDERVIVARAALAEAESAAFQARLQIQECDGRLALLDAALADKAD